MGCSRGQGPEVLGAARRLRDCSALSSELEGLSQPFRMCVCVSVTAESWQRQGEGTEKVASRELVRRLWSAWQLLLRAAGEGPHTPCLVPPGAQM